MSRYLLLNLTILVAITLFCWRYIKRQYRAICITIGILVISTALFDSLIIGLGIVHYHQAHILGIYIGKAPIEDFAYALAACLLMPTLFTIYRNYEKTSRPL
jgi:lycopene cyclase domain-containing protein